MDALWKDFKFTLARQGFIPSLFRRMLVQQAGETASGQWCCSKLCWTCNKHAFCCADRMCVSVCSAEYEALAPRSPDYRLPSPRTPQSYVSDGLVAHDDDSFPQVGSMQRSPHGMQSM